MDMKQFAMTWRKETRLSPVPPPEKGSEGRADSAFDLWLRRGLHQLFDEVAREPVPEELLRLIEDHRSTDGRALHGASHDTPEAGKDAGVASAPTQAGGASGRQQPRTDQNGRRSRR